MTRGVFKNLTGKQFGRLFVLQRIDKKEIVVRFIGYADANAEQ